MKRYIFSFLDKMSLLRLPGDLLLLLLQNLEIADLVSISYTNKTFYSLYQKNRKSLLQRWNRKIYDFEIEIKEITTVINFHICKCTRYTCPLCLRTYYHYASISCKVECIDCGRNFCKEFHTLLGMIGADDFYRKEPLRISDKGKGKNEVYRCYDCHLFEYITVNYHYLWIDRVFTPEEKQQRENLIAERKIKNKSK